MSPAWKSMFRNRMIDFESQKAPRPDQTAVSIKVRVSLGCFHREHSPHAYEILDRHLLAIHPEDQMFSFREHESGPEILVYLAVTTAGITLAKSVIDLITTIIKARSEGIKKGDHPSAPIELIVRRVYKDGEVHEETVLRVAHNDVVDPTTIQKKLEACLAKLVKDESEGMDNK